MQPVDYKSHELNLYSNDNVGRLRFVDGKGTGLGPGFNPNQNYIFAKYTDDAKGQYQWPVCIPELHTIDNVSGYVIGVGWALGDGKEKLNDEAKARADADSKLTTDLAAEAKARSDADSKLTTDLATEAKASVDGDASLQAQVGGLWGGLQTIEADSKTRDSALDGKITTERTRAVDAEGVISANLAAELKNREDADIKLSDRINFIVSNTNPSAIDSLTELLSHFSQNGETYVSRLVYLESVVSALVAKNQ